LRPVLPGNPTCDPHDGARSQTAIRHLTFFVRR
jgi:hypothetical protein